jgi:uncharacterized protein DUF6265
MPTFRIVIAILFFSLIGAGLQSAAAATDLKDLAWLAGNWTGTQDGLEMEELWIAPKGNTMLGLHRDVKAGRTASFEFLRIEATADAITYWASPRGKAATPFRLIELRDKRVVFENAEHDFPSRIIYWLDAKGSLHAKIEGTLGGKPAAEEWTWRRTRSGGR